MQADSLRHSDRAALRLIACVSEQEIRLPENDAAQAYRYNPMRMSTAHDSGLLEAAAGVRLSPESSGVMLCGNPAMIEEMRKPLHSRGLTPCRKQKPGQLLTENYW